MKTEEFIQAFGSQARTLHRLRSTASVIPSASGIFGQERRGEFRRDANHSRAALTGWIISLNFLLLACCSRAEPIACGQTLNGSLSSSGETRSYTFDAAAGETVDVLTLSQAFNAVAEVDEPGGTRLGGSTNGFTGALKIPTTGTYTIRIHGDTAEATGVYGVSLTFLTGRCGASLIWGPPLSGEGASLAQVDCYTFSANAGEGVVLNSASTNFAPAAFIADPQGAIVANWVSGTTTLSNLTSTGTYTVGVYSFVPGGTGNYSLSLYFSKLVPASYRIALNPTNRIAALRLWGEPGRATTLRYATNFVVPMQWFTLTNFSLPWSPYRFVDESAVGVPQRFYQTVQ